MNVTKSNFPEAFQALQVGDKNRHDQLIHTQINKMIEKFDVIVLAQYSTSQSLDTYKGKDTSYILTAPKVAVNSIVKLI